MTTNPRDLEKAVSELTDEVKARVIAAVMNKEIHWNVSECEGTYEGRHFTFKAILLFYNSD